MSDTERTRRRRERLREEAAREADLERRYFSVAHPLSAEERRQFARELGIVPQVHFIGK